MMSNFLFFLFANIIFLLAGFTVLRLFRFDGSDSGLFTRLSFYYMTGIGVVSLQMFFYSLLSVPFNIILISAVWVILAAHALYRDKGFALTPGAGPPLRKNAWEKILLLVIASQVIYAFVFAPLMTITAWDSWQTWLFKARVFYLDKGIHGDFFKDPLVHPDYPLLIPLSTSWIYICIGEANELMARLSYPIQLVSLLSIFHYFVKKATSSYNALFFTALLSLTPVIMIHAAGFMGRVEGFSLRDFVGYADLALAIYFIAACGFFYFYCLQGARQYLFLTGLFLGMGAWTKDEGFVFVSLGGLVVFLQIFLYEKKRKKDFLKFCVVVAALTLPWVAYKLALGIPGEYEVSANLRGAWERTHRLPYILMSFKESLFELTSTNNFTWYAYCLTTLLSLGNLLRRPFIYVHFLILAQFSAYLFVYTITFLDLDFHLVTSKDRVILHLIPIAMFITAVNYHGLIEKAELRLKLFRAR